MTANLQISTVSEENTMRCADGNLEEYTIRIICLSFE